MIKLKQVLPYQIEIREYVTRRGVSPFQKWYKGLNVSLRTKVDARLQRIRVLENFGDCKFLGEGIYELRFMAKSGVRIYFAKEKSRLVLLLVGGDKSSQRRDIEKAKKYWKDYRERGE